MHSYIYIYIHIYIHVYISHHIIVSVVTKKDAHEQLQTGCQRPAWPQACQY